jgi:phosphoglycolate phosphatase-like HAD superfamily hydrolase
MYQSYIWDFDGTLYDSYPIMLKAFIKTLKEYGFDPDLPKKLLKNTT